MGFCAVPSEGAIRSICNFCINTAIRNNLGQGYMNAIFVLGTFEVDAIQFGQALTWRTQGWLDELARHNGLEADIAFVIQDEIQAGRNKAKIGIESIRSQRPRILDEIHAARAELVVVFGPVAAACVFDHGNMREGDLRRRSHRPLGRSGPTVVYLYGLENIKARPGLRQWWHLDLRAALDGHTEPQYGAYTIIRPGDKEWDACPDALKSLLI